MAISPLHREQDDFFIRLKTMSITEKLLWCILSGLFFVVFYCVVSSGHINAFFPEFFLIAYLAAMTFVMGFFWIGNDVMIWVMKFFK
jgi:hypothetical protein